MGGWFNRVLATPFRRGYSRQRALTAGRRAQQYAATAARPQRPAPAPRRRSGDGRWFWRGFWTAAALHRWHRWGGR